MKNKWTITRPSGRELCSARHVSHLGVERAALHILTINKATDGEEVRVEVQPKDRSALTVVGIRGIDVAEIRVL